MNRKPRTQGVDSGASQAANSPPRRAKIICTIGPACNTEAILRDLMRLGMDVARLNFSHGSHPEHARNIERLRRAAQREKRTICILQDLQGPKIRTGWLKGHGSVTLKSGAQVTITPRDIEGNAALISTTFPDLAREVQADTRVLLADGLIELRVLRVRGSDVECEVVNGGVLGEHKGINLPGIALSIPAFTEKDREDLKFGLKHGVDAVAISFVRSSDDVQLAKQMIADAGSDVPVIAKLEKPQALDQLEQILETADGVMVARGDLGVEMPPEQIPAIQKRIIRRAAEWRKPVITATQMLESMIENPRPTRAEASDVANAVFDGSDALMLSAETATGRYPCQTVAMMARIVVEAERHLQDFAAPPRRRTRPALTIAETICESVAHAAEDLPMGAIAVFSASGNTARMISKYRPRASVYAFAHRPEVCNRLNLYWGVRPMMTEQALSAEQMRATAERELLCQGKIRQGDVLGVVAGPKGSGSTNFLHLHTVSPKDALRARRARPGKSRPRG